MNLPQRFTHSYYSYIIKHARTLSTLHPSRISNNNNKTTHQAKSRPISNNKLIKKQKSVLYPPKFANLRDITEEQKNLILQKILIETNTYNHTDTSLRNTNALNYSNINDEIYNSYISNLMIDMIYTHYCETKEGIPLFDKQFEMRWKKFIIKKYGKIFNNNSASFQTIFNRLINLPLYLESYRKRMRYFIQYEYDRVTFIKPYYIYPTESEFIHTFVSQYFYLPVSLLLSIYLSIRLSVVA